MATIAPPHSCDATSRRRTWSHALLPSISTDDSCAICLDPLTRTATQDQRPVRLNICRHVFHQACIADWQRQSDACPLCRSRDPNAPIFCRLLARVSSSYAPGYKPADIDATILELSRSFSNIELNSTTLPELRLRLDGLFLRVQEAGMPDAKGFSINLHFVVGWHDLGRVLVLDVKPAFQSPIIHFVFHFASRSIDAPVDIEETRELLANLLEGDGSEIRGTLAQHIQQLMELFTLAYVTCRV
ncbi:uncharacterized protein MONBRDRAFT_6978 [Monosiga brevicollis MX1]|uniref:RING-type domain-containing protein n=1 Tax=Monosiga brevicollis TaxID=81824 RepID=A9UVJ0_MONBE|nr:uncharacterized protein MONBRDRAFT_6978 [Monosiga brevicollis MX1]EDQ90407.1 predicted protein [Monosiga brevicollis MX1]|eukprot:XP_001744458.1 hypothetical protein [Monosiga brevicollis MX1]